MTDAAFQALWKNVLDNWHDERAHSAFLEHCRTSDRLAEAAARYRGMKGDRERGPSAEKRLAGVATIAFAKLESARSQPPPTRPHLIGLLLATVFTLAAIGLLAYLLRSP
jgi:hypothetical protein